MTSPFFYVSRLFVGFLFFSILWGLVWFGIKNLILKLFVGLDKEERRLTFRSRMKEPFDLQGLLARHSERRIRIADMIGRRGRFIVIQLAGFAYLYGRIAQEPTAGFLTLFLQDNLFDAIAPGGSYVCVTPNRLNGPHDVSKFFDTVARGFHLKEYTIAELEALFHEVGFRRVEAWPRFDGRYVRLPLGLVKGFEAVFGLLPASWRRSLGRKPFFRNLLSAPLRAIK